MLQFNIPQFIETEDRVVGPLTLKQFGFLIFGSMVLGFLWFVKANIFTFILTAIPVVALTVTLAFVRVNGSSFSVFLNNMIIYVMKPSLFLWSRDIEQENTFLINTIKKKKIQPIENKEYSQKRVNEIAWILDTYGEKNIEPN